MTINESIKMEELQTPIRSDKALSWVSSLIERFHETNETREFLRLKKGVTKELIDELYPLGKYAKRHYNNPEVYLKFYPGSEFSYDADFVDIDGNLVERIEVTMAIDGQQSRIQSEAINKFGSSPIYHTPKYTGTAKNREIEETEFGTIGSDEIIEIQQKRLNSAYLKKHQNLHKYPDTTLLIGVDIPLFMEWEYQRIISQFKPQEDTFKSIKCVNISSNHCWCLK